MSKPYEIVATSVTSGLVIKLGEIFPGVTRYRETIPAQLLVFPHFFVNQITVNLETERRNQWKLDFLASIRYREVSDPSTITGSLQERLDAVGLKLLTELLTINWGGTTVTLHGAYTEKIDGVLHWFANVTVMATKPIEELIKQAELYVNVNIKEES